MAKDLKRVAIARIRVVEHILREWDPIGVQPGVEGPSDEYDTYAPHIVSLASGGCTAKELAVHLESLCVETIGLNSTSASRRDSQEIASRILSALQPSNRRWSGP